MISSIDNAMFHKSDRMKVSLFNCLLFAIGILINAATYGSIAPVLTAFSFLLGGYLILSITPMGGHYEWRIYTRVFAIGFVVSGIAAFYANQLEDVSQLYSDAGGFYDMAATRSKGMSIADIQAINEGALGIVLWRAFYDLFAELGMEKGRYIGISINILAVSMTGVASVKIIRKIYGIDEYRLRRLILLFSSCGMIWLFSGIHLRDSVILLGVTSLITLWVFYLVNPKVVWRLGNALVWTLLGLAYIGLLRQEFVFVPIAIMVSALAALTVRSKYNMIYRITFVSIMIVFGIVLSSVAGAYLNGIVETLNIGRLGYASAASSQHSSDSLGMALIVNQALPIRIALGSIYLFVNPIPFWSGFQLESAYDLFKSMNVIFNYFVIPLLVIALYSMIVDRNNHCTSEYFMLILVLGFSLAVAASSLETRHIGAFLVPLFVLVSIPDCRRREVWTRYKLLLIVEVLGISTVHLAWILLKLTQ